MRIVLMFLESDVSPLPRRSAPRLQGAVAPRPLLPRGLPVKCRRRYLVNLKRVNHRRLCEVEIRGEIDEPLVDDILFPLRYLKRKVSGRVYHDCSTVDNRREICVHKAFQQFALSCSRLGDEIGAALRAVSGI